MIRSIIFTLICLTLLWCESNAQILEGELESRYMSKIRVSLRENMVDKAGWQYVSIYSTGDSTLVVAENQRWFKPGLTPTRVIPVENILRIKSRKRGAMGKAMLIGAGVGALAGTLLGSANYDRCFGAGCFFTPKSRSSSMLIGGFLGLITGVEFGALIGAAKATIRINGNQKVYVDQREKLKRWSITGY